MGASKQQRRKKQRLIQAKKVQKESNNAVPLPVSETAYKIIGGISPETFETPDTDVPKRNYSSYKIISRIASEILALPEPSKEVVSIPAEDRRADYVMQHSINKPSTSDPSENRIDDAKDVDG